MSLALAALVVAFAKGLYSDVARKTRIRADELAIQAAECYLSRVRNDCIFAKDGSAYHPTPALDTLCKKWVACERRGKHADRDAYSASVWGETMAETINSFAQRISSTAVVFAVLVVVVVLFFVSSAAFGYMHRRVADSTGEKSAAADIMERDAIMRANARKTLTYPGMEGRASYTAR